MKKSFMYVVACTVVLLLVAGCAPQPTAVDGPTSPSSAQGESTTAPAAEPAAASAPATFHFAFLDEPPGIDPTIFTGRHPIRSLRYAL